MRRSIILLLCIILSVSSFSQVSKRIQDSILNLLQPASLPYDYTFKESVKSDQATVREISYRVTPVHKASAWYINSGDTTKKKPLIIFMHWGGGNKDEFIKESLRFTSKGFMCISLDAPWNWATYDTTTDFLVSYPGNIQLSVLSVKRAIDLAVSKFNAGDKKVFYIGHSYGATLGGLLAAAEPRIKAMILMAGLPNISASMIDDKRGFWQRDKENRKTIFDQVTYRLSLMEPEDYINLSKTLIYHQCGNKDEIVSRDESMKYIAVCKRIGAAKWYDTDHLFSSNEAVEDRENWLMKEVK